MIHQPNNCFRRTIQKNHFKTKKIVRLYLYSMGKFNKLSNNMSSNAFVYIHSWSSFYAKCLLFTPFVAPEEPNVICLYLYSIDIINC